MKPLRRTSEDSKYDETHNVGRVLRNVEFLLRNKRSFSLEVENEAKYLFVLRLKYI